LEVSLTWQAEFFVKASEANRAYEEAKAMTQEVIQDDGAAGPEWDAAVAHQLLALGAWSALYHEYSDRLSEGEKASE
jgi:hypothetical protein